MKYSGYFRREVPEPDAERRAGAGGAPGGDSSYA
jgi:hypothetical protein